MSVAKVTGKDYEWKGCDANVCMSATPFFASSSVELCFRTPCIRQEACLLVNSLSCKMPDATILRPFPLLDGDEVTSTQDGNASLGNPERGDDHWLPKQDPKSKVLAQHGARHTPACIKANGSYSLRLLRTYLRAEARHAERYYCA
jgi:hypothetical protein